MLKYNIDGEQIADGFLELAGLLRLHILLTLCRSKSSVSTLAKTLDSTSQEIHRNLDRLREFGLVRKESDRKYSITLIGKIICTYLPTFNFIWNNRKFFVSHNTGSLPMPLLQRIGSLNNCNLIEGVTAVLEKWKQIYQNSDAIICDIISEIPPGLDDSLLARLSDGVKYKNIRSARLLEPDSRSTYLKKRGFYDLESKGNIVRKKMPEVTVSVIMSEKEAGVIFPDGNGMPDLKNMFYGNDPDFLSWCREYFSNSWKEAEPFRKIPITN